MWHSVVTRVRKGLKLPKKGMTYLLNGPSIDEKLFVGRLFQSFADYRFVVLVVVFGWAVWGPFGPSKMHGEQRDWSHLSHKFVPGLTVINYFNSPLSDLHLNVPVQFSVHCYHPEIWNIFFLFYKSCLTVLVLTFGLSLMLCPSKAKACNTSIAQQADTAAAAVLLYHRRVGIQPIGCRLSSRPQTLICN